MLGKIRHERLKDWWQELAIASVSLIILLAILLSPTIKPIKTVELAPENQGFDLKNGERIVNEVVVPTGRIEYYIVWVHEKRDWQWLEKKDYENLVLRIGELGSRAVREARSPAVIKREDRTAVLFSFQPLQLATDTKLAFLMEQTGEGVIRVEEPFVDQIGEGEIVHAAFQLGQKKNWISLLLEKINSEPFTGHDISSYFYRGNQIVRGENPYSCTLSLDSPCIGYPAHLPGMYWLTAGFVALGVDSLSDWEAVWRPISLGLWLLVGLIIFGYLMAVRRPALAVMALGFWLFNRWSIEVLRIAHTDFGGVLFLLLSVLLASKWPLVAAFLLGISLSIKQVSIIIVPLFLIWLARYRKLNWRKLVLACGLVLLVPVGSSLPFLIDDPLPTLKGLASAAERQSQSVHGFARSLDAVLDVTHVGKILLMLGLVGCVYVAAYFRRIKLVEGVVMILAIMIAFTPVLYNQYLVWLLPFLPLAVASLKLKSEEKI